MSLPERCLTILDVGHGNCTVIKESDHIMVVDTGPGSALLEFLAQESIQSIDAILISHADQDHIAGVLSLLASPKIKIRAIWLNTDSKKDTAIWDDLLYELDQANERQDVQFHTALTRSTRGIFNHGNTEVEVLAPSNYLAGHGPGSILRDGKKLTSNSISAVIKLSTNGNPIAILPGDLDEVGLQDLIRHENEFNSNILVFPHHGGKPETASIVDFTKQWCDKVNPQLCIFSIGRGRHGTPHPDIISTIKSELPESKIFCSQLSKHCEENDFSSVANHLASVYCHGRDRNHCCAGTIVIDIDNIANTEPDFDAHREFIEQCNGPALCLR